MSSEPWWRVRLFYFRRGGRSDLRRRGGLGLLAANFRSFFVSLIRLLVGATWPVTKLTQPVTKWTLPVTRLTLLVTKLRIAAQSANAIVTQVRRHHPPVRTLSRNLAAGRFTSVDDLAMAANLNPKVIRQGLRLAFLAPELTTAALEGEATFVLKQIPKLLSLSWREQHRSVG